MSGSRLPEIRKFLTGSASCHAWLLPCRSRPGLPVPDRSDRPLGPRAGRTGGTAMARSLNYATCYDTPIALNSPVSWRSSLVLICSNLLTISCEYSLSPHHRQTSAQTFRTAVLEPPRRTFSTSFSAGSPPQTGHFSKGIVFISSSLCNQSINPDQVGRL